MLAKLHLLSPFSFDSLRTRPHFVLGGLGLLLLFTSAMGIATGAVTVAPNQLIAILANSAGLDFPWTYDARQEAVVIAIRLPRILLGLLIGSGLALSGATMQGLFRNPLADPGLIGISSGAALAVTAWIVLGGPLLDRAGAFLSNTSLPLAAFIGSIIATLLVYRLSTQNGRTIVSTMLLAGIAVNALAGAGAGFFVLLATDDQLRDIVFWSLGSLGGATWRAVFTTVPFVGLAILALPRLARSLNALLLGEAEATHLGISIEQVKRVIVVMTALAVGASVAAAGSIGFVGLVVPHLLRLMVGPEHRLVLPGSALLGATILVGADTIARTIIAPAELPIGIVTASLGAPFFLCLLLRVRHQGESGLA